MLNSTIQEIISMIFVLLISFSVHEFAHAYLADSFGDDTPRLAGRVTLNPLAHIDILGALMFLSFGYGWAKPVPVNYGKLSIRSKNAPLYVSLAGPASNLLMAFIAGLPLMFDLVQIPAEITGIIPSLYVFLSTFILFNLILFFFNMMPLFPLDGEKVLLHLLPAKSYATMIKLRKYGSWPMLILVLVLPMLGIHILEYLVFSPAVFIARWLIL